MTSFCLIVIGLFASAACERIRAQSTVYPEILPELSSGEPEWAQHLAKQASGSDLDLYLVSGETATLVSSEIVSLEVTDRPSFASLVERKIDLDVVSPPGERSARDYRMRIVDSQIRNVPEVGDWVSRLGHLLHGAELLGFFPPEGSAFAPTTAVPPALSADLTHISMVSWLMFTCFPKARWEPNSEKTIQQLLKVNNDQDTVHVSCRAQMVGTTPCNDERCLVFVATFTTSGQTSEPHDTTGVTAGGTGTGTVWMQVLPSGQVPSKAKLVYDFRHRLKSFEDDGPVLEIVQTRRAVITWDRTTPP